MTKGMKRLCKGICLLLVLAVVGIGIYQAYFFFLKKAYPMEYQDIVTQQAEKYQVEPALIYAVIRSESNFRPEVESSAGAIGLMQLTPETFEWLQTKINTGEPMDKSALTDPTINIEYGVYLLSLLSSRYDSEITILCAYNAGMGNADRWLQDTETSSDGKTITAIPYPETKSYVDRVLQSKEMYQKLYGDQL